MKADAKIAITRIEGAGTKHPPTAQDAFERIRHEAGRVNINRLNRVKSCKQFQQMRD